MQISFGLVSEWSINKRLDDAELGLDGTARQPVTKHCVMGYHSQLSAARNAARILVQLLEAPPWRILSAFALQELNFQKLAPRRL
jgi:hypothetical protein